MPPDSTPDIFSLADILFSLPDERQARFGRIFHLSSTVGQVVPPEPMEDWITQRFGSPEAIQDQYVVKVTNQVTMEGALFNEVRSLWPASPSPPQQNLEMAEADEDDPFCDPVRLTPVDTFVAEANSPGRVRGQHCITASSLVKLDGYHGLVIFDEHNPLRFTREQLSDYLDVAWRWAELAHQEDSQARYYLVIWNCLPRAAATVVHGHLQMLLTRDVHYPRIEAWRRAAEVYRQTYGQDYFTDLFETHADLGLGFASNGVRVMASLTPVKERETVLIADVDDYARPGAFSEPFKRALFLALDAFINRMGVTTFNLAIYCPPLGDTSEAWYGFPVIARLVDRGDPNEPVSDVGAMELYAASVIRADPFRVAEVLRARFMAG
ncbi:MAG: hypothetical protein Kow0063_25610 [Anaerolineae bacterium]